MWIHEKCLFFAFPWCSSEGAPVLVVMCYLVLTFTDHR